MGTENDGTPGLVQELAAIPYEPLLPVERKLIGGSLLLGIVLLGLLYWLSEALFPVPGPEAMPEGPMAKGAK